MIFVIVFQTDDDPIHIISVADPPISEKPPEYDSVVLEPPCYDDAIKLSPSTLLESKPYKDAMLPNYNDLDGNVNGSSANPYTAITIVQSSSDATTTNGDSIDTSKISNDNETNPSSNSLR